MLDLPGTRRQSQDSACERKTGDAPTALLPTMAILRCLGAGILLLAVWEVLAVAERSASVEDGVLVGRRGERC